MRWSRGNLSFNAYEKCRVMVIKSVYQELFPLHSFTHIFKFQISRLKYSTFILGGKGQGHSYIAKFTQTKFIFWDKNKISIKTGYVECKFGLFVNRNWLSQGFACHKLFYFNEIHRWFSQCVLVLSRIIGPSSQESLCLGEICLSHPP